MRKPATQDRRSRGAPPRRRNDRRGRAPARPTLFHAPSFSAGVVLGAVIVLGGAYLPDLVSGEPVVAGPAEETAASRPELTFEFDDLLRNSQVIADPEPYRSEPEPTEETADEEILLQAASFRAREDAERLRAALLLMDLPATTQGITLANGAWYRVTVGPFTSRVAAERALTRLREKDIAAIWTRRPRS